MIIFWTGMVFGAVGMLMWEIRKAKKAQLKKLQDELTKYKKYYSYQ